MTKSREGVTSHAQQHDDPTFFSLQSAAQAQGEAFQQFFFCQLKDLEQFSAEFC